MTLFDEDFVDHKAMTSLCKLLYDFYSGSSNRGWNQLPRTIERFRRSMPFTMKEAFNLVKQSGSPLGVGTPQARLLSLLSMCIGWTACSLYTRQLVFKHLYACFYKVAHTAIQLFDTSLLSRCDMAQKQKIYALSRDILGRYTSPEEMQDADTTTDS
jgi:hypothetical protein